jgi:hypothetical protein
MVLVVLVAAAGNALVQAMVTDGWEGVRAKVARLFGRGSPDPKVEARLDATRGELTAADPADLEKVQAVLAGRWQTRFADLLADHPDAEAELAELVRELRPVITSAAGHSVTAGRDVNVSADHGSVAAGVIHGDVTLPGPTMPASAGG